METIGAWLSSHAGAVIGGIWSILAPLGFQWIRREVQSYLKVNERQKTAEWIAHLADEIIDGLRTRYPSSRWLERLDDAITTLADAAGISPQVADRAIRAAAGRKLSLGATSDG